MGSTPCNDQGWNTQLAPPGPRDYDGVGRLRHLRGAVFSVLTDIWLSQRRSPQAYRRSERSCMLAICSQHFRGLPSGRPRRAGGKARIKCTCDSEARILIIVERLARATFAYVSAPGFHFNKAGFHQTEPHGFHVVGVLQRYLLDRNSEMPSFVTRGKSSELCVFCVETGVVFCSDSSDGICLDENLIMAPSPLATRTFPQGKAQLQSRLCQSQIGVI